MADPYDPAALTPAQQATLDAAPVVCRRTGLTSLRSAPPPLPIDLVQPDAPEHPGDRLPCHMLMRDVAWPVPPCFVLRPDRPASCPPCHGRCYQGRCCPDTVDLVLDDGWRRLIVFFAVMGAAFFVLALLDLLLP